MKMLDKHRKGSSLVSLLRARTVVLLGFLVPIFCFCLGGSCGYFSLVFELTS